MTGASGIMFGAFGGKSHAELLTARADQGPGDGNQAVSVGIILHHRQDPGAFGDRAPQGSEIRPQGGKGDGAPSAELGGHLGTIKKRACLGERKNDDRTGGGVPGLLIFKRGFLSSKR